jgi:hypothetical protein
MPAVALVTACTAFGEKNVVAVTSAVALVVAVADAVKNV